MPDRPVPNAPADTGGPPAEAGAVTVLIVDDDPVLRSIMQGALEDEGYAVIEAANGVEALRLCAGTVPCVVVADAVMPLMDGFQLCRALRADAATRHVPILMATGLDDPGSIARAYEAGATDFIVKPLNWMILGHRVRYMLRGANLLEALRRNEERLTAAQDKVRAQSARFSAALGNMSQGLCMFGADGRLTVSNDRFREIYQLSAEACAEGRSLIEVLRMSPLFSAAPDDGAMSAQLAEYLALASRRKSAVLSQELADGRTIAITHEPMADGGFVDTFTDVTGQREAEAKIAHMALHDPLTDLPNRVLFRERLEHALHRLQYGERCAVLYLDLDNFKSINDTLGHLVGDAVLNAVAERLRRRVRQSDTVARLGGDEFAIVRGHVEQSEDVAALAMHILDDLRAPFELAGQRIFISASVGIAMPPNDGYDADTLLKSSDIAMYEAKGEGRDRFRHFQPIMTQAMEERRQLESELRDALQNGDFELHFQPLVHLARRRITAFEALLRWNNPRRGLVSPATFIPILEEVGLISEVGEWALRQACRCAMSWPAPVKVAVNVSPVQFSGRHMVPLVKRALDETGLDPARLELEVTESVMIRDFDAALSQFRQLKEIGVGISMDDFGTGYSSLSYVRAFPFDKIKIDRSFIREIGRRPEATAIIRAVTGMCNSLGIAVAAEGVETDQQLSVLLGERCAEIQGFLISKPRPEHEVNDLIRAFEQDGWDRAGMDLSGGKPLS